MFVHEYTIRVGRGKNCSKKCQFASQKTSIERVCSICGKKVVRFKSAANRKKTYCSKKCQIKGIKMWNMDGAHKYLNERKGIDKLVMGKQGKSLSYDGYYVFSGRKMHRHIMEQHIGRKLLPTEIVHHINHNKLDNRIENLQIVSRAEHNKIHKFFKK
jgi:endogenous inhibitor of DNA gyrase (YacG/DUF329 family)